MGLIVSESQADGSGGSAAYLISENVDTLPLEYLLDHADNKDKSRQSCGSESEF